MRRGSTRAVDRTLGICLSFLLLAGGAVAVAQQPADDDVQPEQEQAEAPVKQIKLTAENWKWTPNVVRVKQGTRLVIDFQSWDASHSFKLKAFGIDIPLPQDKTAHVEFVADKVGKFKWRCGRPCGDGCPKMVGKLIVEE
jgi:heme/copper-type cytochrome/quinol oxidase subunit 2